MTARKQQIGVGERVIVIVNSTVILVLSEDLHFLRVYYCLSESILRNVDEETGNFPFINKGNLFKVYFSIELCGFIDH